MPLQSFSSRLSRVLVLDALTCSALGLLLVALSGVIGTATGLPQPLLFWAGLILFPSALFMVLTAGQRRMQGWAVSAVVIGNIGWIAASIALPVSGLVTPSPLGWIFLIGQAIAVAVLAWFEFAWARSLPAAA